MRNKILYLTVAGTLLGGVVSAQRIKDIATVAGVRYVHLKGIGIVAGLNGTGDSPKNAELQDKFQRILRYWGGGEAKLATKNLALVLVTATVPSFIKPGQSFEVHVASIGDAKDLTGGELLECALRGPITPVDDGTGEEVEYTDYAVAQGKVQVPADSKVKTTGTCTAILEREFGIPFHTNYEYITLLLNQPDFNTASRVAYAINTCGLFGRSRTDLAQAVDAATIQVRIPPAYLKGDRIVDFVSIVLGQIPLSPADIDREATVVIDKRTGAVVVNGEVRVRPFSALVDGMLIQIPPPSQNIPGPLRLMDVIAEFKKQKLTTDDLLTVLHSMVQAGVLEGKVIER